MVLIGPLFIAYIGIAASLALEKFVRDDFGGLETVVGPDTYGLLQQYKTTVVAGFRGFDGPEVNAAEFQKFRAKVEAAKARALTKYKQVSGIFLSSSRFYYNYRHAGNAFSILYQYVKFGRLSNKYLAPIMPETCACHPTNTAAGRIYIESSVDMEHYNSKMTEDRNNKYCEDVFIKYNGHGLLKKHFRYAMTGRYPKLFPNSLKVFTQYPGRRRTRAADDEAFQTKFVYMTGHGGDSYLQFQAKDFISSLEMAKNFEEMHIKEPKMKIFTLLDTCQASTMYKYVDKDIPIAWVASSVRGESSYSHNPNYFISISTCDKFTFVLQAYLKTVLSGIVHGTNKASVSRLSLRQLLRNYDKNVEKERVEYGVNKNIYDEEEQNKKLEKLYLGQFMFNYRKLYLNSLKFHVRPTDSTEPRFKSFKICGIKLSGQDREPSYAEQLMFGLLKRERETDLMAVNGITREEVENHPYTTLLVLLIVAVAVVQERIRGKRPWW